jgi:branched-chain amino acid transport system permease protein
MISAIVGVFVARSTSSPLAGILAAGLLAGILGAIEDGLILKRALTSYIPYDVLERFSFSGALGIYLALTSATEVAGFRAWEILPVSESEIFGLTRAETLIVLICWILLVLLSFLKFTELGARLRAVLDEPSVSQLYGINVPPYAYLLGGISGLLTGVASSSFGLLYFAHTSTGFSLMLLALVPCLMVGIQSSLRVILASAVFISIVVTVRFLFGYEASEFAIYGSIVVILLIVPPGFTGSRLREI